MKKERQWIYEFRKKFFIMPGELKVGGQAEKDIKDFIQSKIDEAYKQGWDARMGIRNRIDEGIMTREEHQANIAIERSEASNAAIDECIEVVDKAENEDNLWGVKDKLIALKQI